MKQTLQNTMMLLAAMAAGYLGGLISQTPNTAKAADEVKTPVVQDEIRAKSFLLIDDDGKIRGKFGIKNGDPGLSLLTKNEKEKVRLELMNNYMPLLCFRSNDEAVLTLLSETGLTCLKNSDKNITLDYPYNTAVKITIPAGKYIVGEYIKPGKYVVAGTSNFIVFDNDGKLEVNTILGPDGVGIYVCELKRGYIVRNESKTILNPFGE